jgi:CRP-like cAMP-binding protein
VLGRISAEDFDRVYFTNPSLGLALVRLIIDRLSEDADQSGTDRQRGSRISSREIYYENPMLAE